MCVPSWEKAVTFVGHLAVKEVRRNLVSLGLAILAIVAFMWLGQGQPCGPWVEVTVDPAYPTSNDPVTLILSGIWCDSCVPQSPKVSILGKTVTVFTSNKSPMCFPVITPWELRVPLGKLAPGQYSVLVVHNGQPIGGLEIFEVRSVRPDFVIEAMRWSTASPNVGDRYVNFEVMVVNVGGERAPLSGVVLELYKLKEGRPIVIGRTSWTSGYLDPKQTIVATVTTFPYSQLTWEGGTFWVRACMDAADQVQEADETNNCLDRQLTIQGTPAPLLVTAQCITLPAPYSLLDVPILYQVKDPSGVFIESGTKKTPFTLVYPRGFQVLLDAPNEHDLHRFWNWKITGAAPFFSTDPLAVVLEPAIKEAEVQYTLMPERKCTECFQGLLGPSDTCGNGVGYSIPGPAGGDPHCSTPDCCGWYQVSHVHDLQQNFVNVHLILEYTPGFSNGCQGTLTVEISLDNHTWIPVYTGPTTTVDLNPPHQLWGIYMTCINIPRMTEFRYVRVTVTNCYIDYSAVYICVD